MCVEVNPYLYSLPCPGVQNGINFVKLQIFAPVLRLALDSPLVAF
jgi:hypothetical protein